GINVEHDIMRLAVLGDAVSEAAQAPGFSLDHLAAVVGDNLGGVFRERIDLSLSQILSREENMLVKRHVPCTYVGGSLTRAPCARPSGCRSKVIGQVERTPWAGRAYGESPAKRQVSRGFQPPASEQDGEIPSAR